MNTKSHGWANLQNFYSPPRSPNYIALQLDLFNIGHNRGSFLHNGSLPSTTPD